MEGVLFGYHDRVYARVSLLQQVSAYTTSRVRQPGYSQAPDGTLGALGSSGALCSASCSLGWHPSNIRIKVQDRRTIPFLELGVQDNNTAFCAGAMPYRRDDQDLGISSLEGHDSA